MQQAVAGAVAGLAATAPMTLFMKRYFYGLPREAQYPLPPREITMNVADAAGVREQLGHDERKATTLAAHFGYGAAAGLIYPLVAENLPGPPLVKGIAFGLAVWGVSYLGYLPVLGLTRSAVNEHPSRNALMIAAHLVWGGATGYLTAKLLESRP